MSTATDDNLQLREYVPQFTSTLNDPNIDDERKEKEITSLNEVLCELDGKAIDGLVTVGFVRPLLRVLIERGDTRETSSLKVLIQALIALTYITSSTVAAAVVEKKGVVLLLIRCLRRLDNPDVSHYAALSLGNIALLGPETRDNILELGTLQPALEHIADHRFDNYMKNILLVVKALCLVESTPNKSLMEPAIETFWEIYHSDGTSDKVKSYVVEVLTVLEEVDPTTGEVIQIKDLEARAALLERSHRAFQHDIAKLRATESSLGTTSPPSATTGDVIQIEDLEARAVLLGRSNGALRYAIARLRANRGTEINRAHGQEVDQNQPAI